MMKIEDVIAYVGIALGAAVGVAALIVNVTSQSVATTCHEQCAIDRRVCEETLKRQNYRHYKLVCGVGQRNCEKLCNVEDETMASVVK